MTQFKFQGFVQARVLPNKKKKKNQKKAAENQYSGPTHFLLLAENGHLSSSLSF